MPDANGGVTAHRLTDLERRMEHTLTREVFEARMASLAGQLDALHAELKREREAREREERDRQRVEANRRNILIGAAATATLSLIATLLLAGLIALSPGQAPVP